MTLTAPQREAADAIVEMNVALGRPPTIGELATRLGIGNTSTFARIARLRAAGFLLEDERIALSPHAMIRVADAINALLVLGAQPGGVPWPKPWPTP